MGFENDASPIGSANTVSSLPRLRQELASRCPNDTVRRFVCNVGRLRLSGAGAGHIDALRNGREDRTIWPGAPTNRGFGTGIPN